MIWTVLGIYLAACYLWGMYLLIRLITGQRLRRLPARVLRRTFRRRRATPAPAPMPLRTPETAPLPEAQAA